MSQLEKPRFPGVYVAAATMFHGDGSLDLDASQAHFARLAEAGVAGLIPNGSLGEYEALTDDERGAVVKSAMDSAGKRVDVVPGVSGKSAGEARRWAEHAANSGCRAVMCLPPTSHAPTADEVFAHFREVARVGLPIIVYNNPFSTRVDLTPPLLARLAEIDQVTAVKEFSQDVRRVVAIREAAPRLEVICGCDDTFVEAMFMGATGWIAGFRQCLSPPVGGAVRPVRGTALAGGDRTLHGLPAPPALGRRPPVRPGHQDGSGGGGLLRGPGPPAAAGPAGRPTPTRCGP